MDTIVTVKDMQQRLSELLQRAAQGERVIIRQRGKPSLALIKLNEADEQTTLPGPETDTKGQRLEHAQESWASVSVLRRPSNVA